MCCVGQRGKGKRNICSPLNEKEDGRGRSQTPNSKRGGGALAWMVMTNLPTVFFKKNLAVKQNLKNKKSKTRLKTFEQQVSRRLLNASMEKGSAGERGGRRGMRKTSIIPPPSLQPVRNGTEGSRVSPGK